MRPEVGEVIVVASAGCKQMYKVYVGFDYLVGHKIKKQIAPLDRFDNETKVTYEESH